MAAASIHVPVTRTNRHDRAALGVIATYLHELTEHGRPREPQAQIAPALAPAAAAPTLQLTTLGELDDELAEMAGAGCYACAA
jgi:hypothetical protein